MAPTTVQLQHVQVDEGLAHADGLQPAPTGIAQILAAQEVGLLTSTGGVVSSLLARILSQSRSISATNTQLQIVLQLDNLHDLLSIISVASGGTSTLTVEASTDNTNWTTIDSIAAALAQAKSYSAGANTVGATTAVSPLAYRFVRITAGAAGVGNTVTLTVGAK